MDAAAVQHVTPQPNCPTDLPPKSPNGQCGAIRGLKVCKVDPRHGELFTPPKSCFGVFLGTNEDRNCLFHKPHFHPGTWPHQVLCNAELQKFFKNFWRLSVLTEFLAPPCVQLFLNFRSRFAAEGRPNPGPGSLQRLEPSLAVPRALLRAAVGIGQGALAKRSRLWFGLRQTGPSFAVRPEAGTGRVAPQSPE